MKLEIKTINHGFELWFGDCLVLRHTNDCPSLVIARGQPTVTMRHGNFRIEDSLDHRQVLEDWRLDGRCVTFLVDGVPQLRLELGASTLDFHTLDAGVNRLWVDFHAEPGEAVWGGGEQMSYFALDGRRFPLWTSEPGVGRDKSTALTQLMDKAGMAGGDYWNTNYPQPTMITARWLALHLDSTHYSVIDCSDPTRHRFEVWAETARFELFAAADPQALVGQLSTRFGRPPRLPDWAIGGAILGLKDGTRSFDRLERFAEAGTTIAGLWCEDWAGIRETSFGRRLFWDWRAAPGRYPDLARRIAELNARGIRFLAYANPYLAVDGALYQEALAGNHLCLRQDSDAPYLVDFGEFDCGVLDFTRPETCSWFARRILCEEMLDIGVDGWMADFGEYLPTDVRLANGMEAMEAHNLWPVLWAQVNAQALAMRGRTGDALFFMRAGFSGVSAHCPLLWAGDQSVDFTRHDGLGTVITAALSAGLVGNAYSHSDCGGYTSLHGNLRSAELMHRWCELAAFAPVMRSHEGNRPDDNLQYDSTPALLADFARWSRVHAALAPYVRHLCDEAVATGLPAQRALFLHYPEDRSLHRLQDQYLYGADLLVAPVIAEGALSRPVVLPGATRWRHLWTGADFEPGKHDISAPLGQPPVFYKPDSVFAPLFASLKEIATP